ncbi:MAG: PTS mannose/fructose/sorbose/N-acetylgalactosamine transporter subunit IIC [Bacilli bacterium]
MAIWQILALTFYGFIQQPIHLSFGYNAITRPVTAGLITGLIMGDVQTGMIIGGTMELLVLGVGTFGGASIPDYFTATLVGTALSVVGGLSPEEGVALALPVAVLMVQLDIFGRMANTFVLQRAKKYAEVGDIKGIRKMNILGTLPWGLSRAIPIFIVLVLGSQAIDTIISAIPESLMTGLGVAAGILPVVGIAILLRYLPFKNLFVYFIVGFILAAAFGQNLLMITILGGILIFILYKNEMETNATIKSNDISVANNNYGGEIDD